MSSRRRCTRRCIELLPGIYVGSVPITQATALVHEAYLKIFGRHGGEFTDEVHFLAVASRVMRQVLVDYGRSRARAKTGWRPGQESAVDDRPRGTERQRRRAGRPDRIG